MALHDKKKLLEKAIELIKEKELYFIEDLVTLLPISKVTFYDYYKIGSNELNIIKAEIDIQKVEMKIKLRKKLYNRESDTSIAMLYKLICTDEERKKLSQTYIDHTTGGEPLKQIIKIGDQTLEF